MRRSIVGVVAGCLLGVVLGCGGSQQVEIPKNPTPPPKRNPTLGPATTNAEKSVPGLQAPARGDKTPVK